MIQIRAGNEEDKKYIIHIRPQASSFFADNGYFIVAQEDEILGCAMVFCREIPAPITAEEAFINLIEVFEQSNWQKGIAASHRLWLKNGFGISPVKYSDGSIIGSFVTYVL